MSSVKKNITVTLWDNNKITMSKYNVKSPDKLQEQKEEKIPYRFILCDVPTERCNIDLFIFELLYSINTTGTPIVKDKYIKFKYNNKYIYFKKINYNGYLYLIKSNNDNNVVSKDDLFLDLYYIIGIDLFKLMAEFKPVPEKFVNEPLISVIQVKYIMKYYKYKTKYLNLKLQKSH